MSRRPARLTVSGNVSGGLAPQVPVPFFDGADRPDDAPSPVILLLSLDVGDQELLRLRGYLSEEELRRGNRLLDAKRRDHFFAGRGILRELLGGFLGEEPSGIELTEGEFGKPHVGNPGNYPGRIEFNLSHAGSYLLAAFTSGRRVGVDLELIQRDLAFRAMAERYFSVREREELFSLPPDEQLAAFYRCWTRKEAYLKGIGSGFSRPSTDFDVTLLPGQPAALVEHRELSGEIGKWRFEEIDVPEGYCAALAVELE